MKKTVFATLIVALLAVAVVIPVAAQAPAPQSPGFSPGGNGYNADNQTYPMHDTMMAAFAAELGLTVEEVEAAIAEGKTVYEIAAENGITEESFYSIIMAARQASIDEGVAQGYFTQERADWMSQRQTNMQNGEFDACIDGTVDRAENGQRGNGRGAGRRNTQQ
jgi:hypothetical protein